MKKWLVVLMAFITMVIPFGSVSADILFTPEHPYFVAGRFPDYPDKVYYYGSYDPITVEYEGEHNIKEGVANYYLRTSEKLYYIEFENGEKVKSHSYLESKFVSFSSYVTDSDFLHPRVKGVEEIPRVMKMAILDGGILLTALGLLAILLGVSLIPRLVRLFSR